MTAMARPEMSARAVTVRLKRVSQLRRLGLSLKKAKVAKPQESVRKSTAPGDTAKSK
jgi:hypothetical protein